MLISKNEKNYLFSSLGNNILRICINKVRNEKKNKANFQIKIPFFFLRFYFY